MLWAKSSFPVPVSPVMRILDWTCEKRLALSLLVESELERVEQEYLPLKRNYPEFFDNAVDTGDVLTQDGEEFLDAQESLLTGR